MNPDEWENIKALFEAALEQPPSARDSFLAKSCPNEAARLQVEKLLFDHDSADSFLNEPVLDLRALPKDILNQLEDDDLASSVDNEQESSRDSLIGRRAGAYQIDRLIGTGGMASVYLASRADAAYQKQVAIKIVRSESASDEILDRFRNERQTLAGLDHPNIVKLLDGGSTDHRFPFLVMDYVEGRPIDIFCDSRTLSIDQRLDLFCQVCAAVQHAHDHLVIHRDLKPGNILVTNDGTPKLLDFGIAKVLNPPSSANPLHTQKTMRRMTPAYASPEQMRGETITTASDIYSLGVVLYELLTGHRPYHLKRQREEDIERAICEQEPESPSTAISRVETTTRPDGTTSTITPEIVSSLRGAAPGQLRSRLRGDLDNVVLMALQKDPQRRYASAANLAEDIQRHLKHLPVTARPSTSAYRIWKFIGRHRSQVAAVSLMTVVTLGGISYASWKAYRAEETARALLSLPSKGRRSIAVLGFKNVSGNPNMDWLSTALSEMLTTELMAGQKLRTISGEDVTRMKIDLSLSGQESLSRASLARVYKNLGSDYVIVGSYLEFGGSAASVRLDLRLQDAARGETIAAFAESGSEAALQELVAKVAVDLRDKLSIPPISVSEAHTALPSNQKAAQLYSEGLARLRYFDALSARTLLEKAIVVESDFALAHSALAMAWLALGHDQQAKQEARYAFDLSANLSREDRLVVEARYRVTTYEWHRVVEIYSTLFEFFPDNLEYGLRLVEARAKAGQTKDALSTLNALRSLPSPLGDDPRIDLEEATYSPGGQAALARALEKAIARGEKMLEAQVRMRQGASERASGNLAQAMPPLEHAKSLFASAGDQNSAAQALHEIAIVQALQNNFPAAQQKFEEALTTYRTSGNEQGQARELNSLGNVLDNQGDIVDSTKSYAESLAIYRRIADKLGVANVLNNWANVVDQQGDLKAARGMFEEVLSTYQDLEDKHGIAMATTNLGMVLYEQGDVIKAKKLTLEALKIGREINDKHGVPYLLATLGEIQKEQGMFGEARKNEEEAEAMRREMGEEELAAESLLDLAFLGVEEKRFQEATVTAKKSAEAFDKSHVQDMEAYAYAVLAQCYLAQKKSEEARETFNRSVALSHTAVIFNIRLPLTILLARLRATLSGYSDPAEMDAATRALKGVLTEAAEHEFWGYHYDASLALGIIEMKSTASRAQGRVRLAAIEKQARAKGFILIARKAYIARQEFRNN